MPTLYKNFEWHPEAKGNEDKTMSIQFMDFCNDLNDKGWIIEIAIPVGKGYVLNCKTEKVDEFEKVES